MKLISSTPARALALLFLVAACSGDPKSYGTVESEGARYSVKSVQAQAFPVDGGYELRLLAWVDPHPGAVDDEFAARVDMVLRDVASGQELAIEGESSFERPVPVYAYELERPIRCAAPDASTWKSAAEVDRACLEFAYWAGARLATVGEQISGVISIDGLDPRHLRGRATLFAKGTRAVPTEDGSWALDLLEFDPLFQGGLRVDVDFDAEIVAAD